MRARTRISCSGLSALAGAGLTSFYMFRLVFLTFFGAERFDEHKVHVHESPKNMTVPLIILAFLSIFGGWFAAPKLVGGIDHFEASCSPFSRLMRRRLRTPAVAGGPESSPRVPAMELFHALTGLAGHRRRARPARGLVVLHQEPGNAEAARRRACTACTRCC